MYLKITTWQVAAAVGAEISVIALTTFLTLRSRFKSNKVRIVVFALGSLLSIGISVSFASALNEIIAAVVLYLAIVYFTFMISFVREYVALVSRHLTFKEA